MGLRVFKVLGMGFRALGRKVAGSFYGIGLLGFLGLCLLGVVVSGLQGSGDFALRSAPVAPTQEHGQ